MATTRNHGGIIHRSLQPGAFYRCATVGNFADPSCNLIIPGCTATVDDQHRVITELRLPDRPVQIPHFKWTTKVPKNAEDPVIWEEVPFGQYCPLGIGEGLQMASDSELIVEIGDDEMRELWPDVFAHRQERMVFDPRNLQAGTAEPMLDLIAKAKQGRLADARAATKQIHDEAASAAK